MYSRELAEQAVLASGRRRRVGWLPERGSRCCSSCHALRRARETMRRAQQRAPDSIRGRTSAFGDTPMANNPPRSANLGLELAQQRRGARSGFAEHARRRAADRRTLRRATDERRQFFDAAGKAIDRQAGDAAHHDAGAAPRARRRVPALCTRVRGRRRRCETASNELPCSGAAPARPRA